MRQIALSLSLAGLSFIMTAIWGGPLLRILRHFKVGKIIRVELLHKLHDELKYDSLDALTAGIARDCDDARAFFASMHAETHRQTTRDRI